MKTTKALLSFPTAIFAVLSLISGGASAKSFGVRTTALPAAPPPPTEAQDPGSANYPYGYEKIELQSRNGTSVLMLPKSNNSGDKFPVIVYGHGQALDLGNYQNTLTHLAQKGFAVLFPQYDTGFWDQDWRRMASDFSQITQEVLQKYGDRLDSSRIMYSGHSKGGYIALMAAGVPGATVPVREVLVFAPAGFDREYLTGMSPQISVSVVWGDQDWIISESSIQDIYDASVAEKKQFFRITGYQGFSADHFFATDQSSASPLQYFGTWRWMFGGEFLYGSEALNTGVPGVQHSVQRNWKTTP